MYGSISMLIILKRGEKGLLNFLAENKEMNRISILFNKDPAAAAAKLLQLRPTLCNPIDGSPRGSPIPGILQARTVAWVAISFSNA